MLGGTFHRGDGHGLWTSPEKDVRSRSIEEGPDRGCRVNQSPLGAGMSLETGARVGEGGESPSRTDQNNRNHAFRSICVASHACEICLGGAGS